MDKTGEVQVMRIHFDFGAYNMGTITIKEANSTGLTNFSEGSVIHIYPNPVADKLYVTSIKPIKKYDILSLTGQKILTGTLNINQGIDVKELMSGYYLVGFSGEDFTKTRTIIKL